MSRRSGQCGHLERKGHSWVVRFWQDAEGSYKRIHRSVRVCPIKGPGALTKPERERRAKELIAESGVDTEGFFNKVQAINLGTNFKQQSDTWLALMEKRRRKPCKPATLYNWKSSLRRWVNPYLGDLPLSRVSNETVKPLIDAMSSAGRGSKCISTAFQLVKAVVGSAKHETTRKALFPITWDHDYLDLPIVTYKRQPSFNGEEISRIISLSGGQFRMLYALLAGSGLRSGEAFGIEIEKHISEDRCTIKVQQSIWNGKVQPPKTPNAIREIDLHPDLSRMLQLFIGDRKSGFLFRTRTGAPLSKTNVLRRNFHPILQKIGWVDIKTGDVTAGLHALRRFRVTWLRKNRAAEDLIQFWLGHARRSVTDEYSMVRDDLTYRKQEAKNLGVGFKVPAENLELVPNTPICTHNSEVSEVA